MTNKKGNIWLRSHSTPLTLKWLEGQYETEVGGCVPRNSMYTSYVDWCATNAMQPVNAASFGKIIRKKFPSLTIRRLGTRGQSKYNYYGLSRRNTNFFSPPKSSSISTNVFSNDDYYMRAETSWNQQESFVSETVLHDGNTAIDEMPTFRDYVNQSDWDSNYHQPETARNLAYIGVLETSTVTHERFSMLPQAMQEEITMTQHTATVENAQRFPCEKSQTLSQYGDIGIGCDIGGETQTKQLIPQVYYPLSEIDFTFE